LAAALALTSNGGIAMTDKPTNEARFCKGYRNKKISSKVLDALITKPQTEFSFDLYQKLAQATDNNDNLVLSPVSVHILLAMLEAGARDKTASEISEALKVKIDKHPNFHKTYGLVISRQMCPQSNLDLKFSMANGLFRQKGRSTEKSFQIVLRNIYNASMIDVDFETTKDQARTTINDWVKTATKGKIKELLGTNDVTRETRMILVNAVHLNDAWRTPFDPDRTKNKLFYTLDGKSRPVPMMVHEGSETDYSYADMKTFHAVSIPTDSGQVEVLIFLPKDKRGFGNLQKTLNSKTMNATIAALQSRRVNLTLPKFKMASRHQLRDQLRELGIKEAFDADKANFGGIDGGRDQLFVTQVIQEAMIEVDERGLEAAAATATGMDGGGMSPKPTEPVEFIADHPFIYILRHNDPGSILFMGRVMNPEG